MIKYCVVEPSFQILVREYFQFLPHLRDLLKKKNMTTEVEVVPYVGGSFENLETVLLCNSV